MKKTIILLSAAALVFAACQKEEGSVTSTNGLKLTATIEQQESNTATKTYLDDLQVKWSSGDQVNVFTDASTPETLTLTLTSGAGTTSGEFSTNETPTGTPQYAIYPAASGNSIAESVITFTLPATQNYVENSFDNGANVAVGRVSGGAITYKNVCGVLKLPLKGNMTVYRMELSGKNDEYLYGTFTVDAANVTTPEAAYSTGGGKTLTLDCGAGVTLSTTTDTDFYFVVPVGAFGDETKPGFTIKVYYTSSDYRGLNTSSSNEINRSRIRTMPSQYLNWVLPSGYEQLEYIECTDSSSYINTNYVANSGISYICEISLTALPNTSPYTSAWIAGNRIGTNERFGALLANNCHWDLGCLSDNFSNTGAAAEANTNYIVNFTSNNSGATLTISSGGSEIDRITSNNTVNNNLPLYIFNINRSGNPTDKGIKGKMYYFKLWDESNNMVRDLIPCCYSAESQVGMYDLVGNSFYPGSGAFVAGPEVD